VEVIQKAMKTLTYKSLCFPESIRARGVEDLPNYYYRDDGMMVWDAVKRYLIKYTGIKLGVEQFELLTIGFRVTVLYVLVL